MTRVEGGRWEECFVALNGDEIWAILYALRAGRPARLVNFPRLGYIHAVRFPDGREWDAINGLRWFSVRHGYELFNGPKQEYSLVP